MTKTLSLIEKVNRIQADSRNSEKGIFGDSSLSPLFGYGTSSRNRDLSYSEYGAAQASQLLVDIAASLNVWEQWLDGITWHIKDINTNETIITTDERVIDENKKGARFFKALKRFRERYKHSYWKSIAISDWIAGETYIRRVRNQAHIPSDLQWLNPLATEPQITAGRIDSYFYSNDDMREVGNRIPSQDMAYRMLRRNIFDDLRGYSPIMSIIDESNLSRNVKRAFRQYFKNGMILGGVIGPDGEEVFSDRDQSKITEMLRRNNSGVENAHTWIISPRKFFLQQFDSKDASKDIAVLADLSKSIHKAMGVPQELSGMPTDATYENLEATQYGWYRLGAIPYAKDIAEYHNNQIIPFIDPGSNVYLEPELSKYEIERPEVVSQDVTASVISLHSAQIKRGLTDADDKLKDIYMVNGRPMHRDVIIKLANTMPADEIEQRANAEESLANAETKPLESSSSESVSAMSAQYDENGTAIPQSEVFGYHIESGIVDINEARAQLGLPPIEKEDANDTDLVQLNSQLQTVITAINAGMSIEEAYESVGLEPPKQEPQSEVLQQPYRNWVSSTPITITHDDHMHVIPVEPAKVYNFDNALNELKAWKKFRKNDPSRDFAPDYLLGDIADSLREAIATNGDIDAAFDSAFEIVRGWQKAIQAVRIDFEDSIEDLLIKARDDSNNFGRVQWASAMRKVIRLACTRAYSDGLIAGGVLDGELSEADQDTLAAHIAEQSQYVTNLGAEIFKTDDGISNALANRKPEMWFRKSVLPMYDAGRESADANGMYEFAGDDGNESCSTCIRLKGQRHRMKDWARKGLRPGVDTDNFECGGWECRHKLVNVSAKARGRF